MMGQEPQPPMARSLEDVEAAIRGSVLGLVISGALCLCFGFTLIAVWPTFNVPPAEQEAWKALDYAFFWCLRIVGLVFLVSAGLAMTGRRASMALALVTEVAFTLLMVAMSVGWTLKARVIGAWNYQVIILLLLAFFGVIGTKRCWSLYRAAGRMPPAPPAEPS